MEQKERIGIIDIGSSSVRLVIYEKTAEFAYRIIDECRETSRLGAKLGSDRLLPNKEIAALADTIGHYKRICQAMRVGKLRAVATAAFREAANGAEAAQRLRSLTGVPIDVVSGTEEARLGFLGMIHSMEISDGFLLDLGGGSTELTLFIDKRIVGSVSIPLGAVGAAARLARRGAEGTNEAIQSIRRAVRSALQKEKWIRNRRGLPLVVLGGTMRYICKLLQRKKAYSLPVVHNFSVHPEEMDKLIEHLFPPAAEGKNVRPKNKTRRERTDIVAAGAVILQTVFREIGASHYRCCAAGLRDGLYFAAAYPGRLSDRPILDRSIDGLLAQYPVVPLRHVRQVSRLALKLFDGLARFHRYDGRARKLLHVSSLLYRIGMAVNPHQTNRHTYYMLLHARLDGLDHREIVLCALIASFRSKWQTYRLCAAHKDLLKGEDWRLAVRLGSLLKLAAALDRSERQPVADLEAGAQEKSLSLTVLYRKRYPLLELQEARLFEQEFKKIWNMGLSVTARKAEPDWLPPGRHAEKGEGETVWNNR